MPKKSVKVVKRPPRKSSIIPGPDDYNVPSDDFFDYYTVIHGTAGIGKSSLLASIPGCVIAQFEPARRNIKSRMVEFRPRTPIELQQGAENPYTKLLQFLEEAEKDNSVKVIGIDNVAECYKCVEYQYLFENELDEIPKNDFGACRGQVNRMFENIFNNLKYDSRLGVIFTCHTKEREGEFNTGTTDNVYSPAVTAAVFDYLKKAMDFAFYYGYHDSKRAIHCRWDCIWTKCGVDGRFMTPSGKPLQAFAIPDPAKGYDTILKAWNNKLKGITGE